MAWSSFPGGRPRIRGTAVAFPYPAWPISAGVNSPSPRRQSSRASGGPSRRRHNSATASAFWLIKGLDDVTGGGLDGDALWGERATAVRGAERMMRFPFLVQAGPGDDVIEHARLALESPQGATLD